MRNTFYGEEKKRKDNKAGREEIGAKVGSQKSTYAQKAHGVRVLLKTDSYERD